MTTLKPEVSQEIMVTVQSTQVNADISLTPKLGGRSLRERKREGGVGESSGSYSVYKTDLHMYHSLAKKGPWAVHLTLGSDRGVGRNLRYQYSAILSAQSGAYCA